MTYPVKTARVVTTETRYEISMSGKDIIQLLNARPDRDATISSVAEVYVVLPGGTSLKLDEVHPVEVSWTVVKRDEDWVDSDFQPKET